MPDDRRFIVEILICQYSDDDHWSADGVVVSDTLSREQADALVKRLVHESSLDEAGSVDNRGGGLTDAG